MSSWEPEGLKIITVCLAWSGCWISWACCVVFGGGVPPQENHRRVSSHRLHLKEEAVSGNPSRYGDGSPGTACSLLLLLFLFLFLFLFLLLLLVSGPVRTYALFKLFRDCLKTKSSPRLPRLLEMCVSPRPQTTVQNMLPVLAKHPFIHVIGCDML